MRLLQQLGTVRGHAVLPAGAGQIAAGDQEGLQASEGKLRHLGLPEAPARSTLAYANSHRPWQLFETVFHQLLADCQKRLGVAKAGAKLGMAGKLLSLDATVIDLCAAVFDWAQFRTTK